MIGEEFMDAFSDVLKRSRLTIMAILLLPLLGVVLAMILIGFFKGLKPPLLLGIAVSVIPYIITLALIWRKFLSKG
ncbi:hypothetical protein DRO56_00210 [Candidatus Bathyarchaeota archaeon]|nr:MAG: hypothetical protein DRO56_00210 [Candidatus Bathyarchaeota archaeon]